jgi:hypothetical protein
MWHRTVQCCTGHVLFTVRCAFDSARNVPLISAFTVDLGQRAVAPLVHRTARWLTGQSGEL